MNLSRFLPKWLRPKQAAKPAPPVARPLIAPAPHTFGYLLQEPGSAGLAKANAQKARLISAIDDEAARLKTKRRVTCPGGRDRLVAVAQKQAQADCLPPAYIREITINLDCLIRLPWGLQYQPEAIDYMADQAREIIRNSR